MSATDLTSNLEPDTKVQCQNCDWHGTASQLSDIDDIEQRISPGEVVPAGQCPKCDALAHLASNPAWVKTRDLDAETVLLIAQEITPDLWTTRGPNDTIQHFYDFVLECVAAFQIIHAQTDWDESGDYWGEQEHFCELVKQLFEQDQHMINWPAAKIAKDVQAISDVEIK